MKNLIKCALVAMCLFMPSVLSAQEFQSSDLIVKTAKSKHQGRIRVTSIENLYDTTVIVSIINDFEQGSKYKTTKKIKKGERFSCDYTLTVLKAKAINGTNEIEIRRATNSSVSIKDEKKDKISQKTDTVPKTPEKDQKKSVAQILTDFTNFVDSVSQLSEAKRIEDSISIAKHIEYLSLPSTDKKAYISSQKLQEYVIAYCDTLQLQRDNITSYINDFINYTKLNDVELSDTCKSEMSNILENRITAFESQISPLKTVVGDIPEKEFQLNWKIIVVITTLLLLCLILFLWYRMTNKAQQSAPKKNTVDTQETNETPSLIIVGKTNAPTLKKQSLEDVYDNAAYLPISSKDFCADSSVRTIYIKNSCIKDIYNLYANDLRNPDNPKEDGCMVLGRWVQDESTQLYDVSLEYVILPGDDAIFSEYELNFGGKIRLKVSDKLRKLRKETGLQYDLTCWVHSHPGLGVFFSNSDNNVHMQLKHPEHPKFLTALVIDILTPQQETGIFTFKQDGEVNSKNDISKMYSLEEMYKHALDSERRSFEANDYYNVLGSVTNHFDVCYGIHLSNSAIIDMTYMASSPNGFMGFVHGYTIEKGDRIQYITTSVSKSEAIANNERLGCFVVASHCSIPSIRKVVGKYLNDIHFVLVYTASDGQLTSIPVINQDLCASDEYYGEQKLEDLKIWTRRRR